MYMALVCHDGLKLKDKKCEHLMERYGGANQAGRYIHCWECKSRLLFARKTKRRTLFFVSLSPSPEHFSPASNPMKVQGLRIYSALLF